MADMTERLAVARKKAEALKSEIAKAQNDKKDCSIQEAAAQIDLKNLGPGLKARRVLKGHFGKVYAMHWSGDNQNLVSASQVSALFCGVLAIGFPFVVRVCVRLGFLARVLRSPATFFLAVFDLSIFFSRLVFFSSLCWRPDLILLTPSLPVSYPLSKAPSIVIHIFSWVPPLQHA